MSIKSEGRLEIWNECLIFAKDKLHLGNKS